MNNNDILRMAGYMAPIISSLLCLLLSLAYRLHYGKNTPTSSRLLRLTIVYFGIVAVNWLNTLLYIFYPAVFVYVNTSYYICLMLVSVVFYHLVYVLTATGAKRFPVIHYVIPVVIVATFAGWSLFVPFDVQLALVTSRGAVQPGYEAYSKFFIYRFPTASIYCFVYLLPVIRQLLHYRKVITGYSADEGRSSLQWLYLLMILFVGRISLPVAALFFTIQVMAESFLTLLPGGILIVQHAVLCYNILGGNYVIIKTEKADKKEKGKALNKEMFEAYIHETKPYLHPELKITDLTLPMITNRTYLSDFINQEYDMNFSRYINLLRLEELERLRKDPAYNHFSEVGLILQAGFSSYQGFRRFVRTEKVLSNRPCIN
ncbi:MAG: hypothetical protein LBN71_04885 [Tannerella sp.]|jgi:AraC-like DNA-binding protein|nr:hypothetical protein [Tannerella sp.]